MISIWIENLFNIALSNEVIFNNNGQTHKIYGRGVRKYTDGFVADVHYPSHLSFTFYTSAT